MLQQPIDRVIARTSRVAVGQFQCPVSHPSFTDSGAISDCLVVFPRTSAWIEHEGRKRFLADATVATIYNRGQRYRRFADSAEGDRCDWFGVSDDIAREIASVVDAPSRDATRPFRVQRAQSSARLYLRQRTLLCELKRGEADEFHLEEETMLIVESVLAAACGREYGEPDASTTTKNRRRELAEAARAVIGLAPERNISVHSLAESLGCSSFHLCRVFRSETGRTLHTFRTELRLRRGLELLECAKRDSRTLSELAVGLGFASHSHFVVALRRWAGITPSVLRAALRGDPR